MIYQHGVKASVNVKKADNGYIIEWEVERSRDETEMFSRISIGRGKELPTRGVQIVTTKKDMIKFIETKL